MRGLWSLIVYPIVSIFILSLPVSAQQDNNFSPPILLPAPPEAASINKGGDISVNLATGTPSLGIPVLNIKSRYLVVPVSINYATNGVRVNDVASNVGLGWSLNCGGSISRTILGVADEDALNASPLNNFTLPAYDVSNRNHVDFFLNDRDRESDIFTFSVNGYISGKFILNSSLQPICLTDKNLKITRVSPYLISDGFIITDANGTSFTFSQAETSSYNNNCSGSSLLPVTNAWQLTSISMGGQDEVTFEYEDDMYQYRASITESESIVMASDMGACPFEEPHFICTPHSSKHSVCLTYQSVQNKRLIKINFLHGYIQFGYGDYRQDLIGSRPLTGITLYDKNDQVIKKTNLQYGYFEAESGYGDFLSFNSLRSPELLYRLYLKEINMEGKPGTTPLKYQFQYKDGNKLPARLSAAQDYLGYYNGKNNNMYSLVNVETENPGLNYYNQGYPRRYGDRSIDPSFLEYGSLTKVTYPTGGYDQLLYDYNKHGVTAPGPPYTTNYYLSVTNDPDLTTTGRNTGTFNIPFSQTVNIGFNLSGTVIDVNDRVSVSVKSIATGAFVYNKTLALADGGAGISLAVSSGDYEVEVTAMGYLTANFSVNYQWRLPDMVTTSQPIGGMSISSILSVDPVTNTTLVKKYEYTNDNGSLSSFAIRPPRFTYELVVRALLGCENSDCGLESYCGYLSQNNNSFNSLTVVGSNAVYHNTVKEITEDNTHQKVIAHTFQYNPVTQAVITRGYTVPNAPYDFYPDILVGEQTTQYYSINKSTLVKTLYKSVSNAYQTNHEFVVKNYATVKHYDPPCRAAVNPFTIEVQAVDVNAYNIYKQNVKLTSSETLTYSGSGSLSEKTDYEYTTNPDYLFLKKQTSKNSKNESLATTYHYIFENPSHPLYAAAIAKNKVSNALEVALTNNGNPLKTNYASIQLIQPDNQVVPYKFDEQYRNSGINNVYENTLFDAYGHVIERRKANNAKEVFLYGYNRSIPIAHIVGVDYNTVVAKLVSTNVEGLQTITDENDLRAKLNEIRTGLASVNAMVTTYTHDPLLGMTSETDANNRTTYYEYDAFGRLSVLRDFEHNVIKKIEYKYQSQ